LAFEVRLSRDIPGYVVCDKHSLAQWLAKDTQADGQKPCHDGHFYYTGAAKRQWINAYSAVDEKFFNLDVQATFFMIAYLSAPCMNVNNPGLAHAIQPPAGTRTATTLCATTRIICTGCPMCPWPSSARIAQSVPKKRSSFMTAGLKTVIPNDSGRRGKQLSMSSAANPPWIPFSLNHNRGKSLRSSRKTFDDFTLSAVPPLCPSPETSPSPNCLNDPAGP
jgi:hypothetical protein